MNLYDYIQLEVSNTFIGAWPQEKVETMEDDSLCKICMDAPVSNVYIQYIRVHDSSKQKFTLIACRVSKLLETVYS